MKLLAIISTTITITLLLRMVVKGNIEMSKQPFYEPTIEEMKKRLETIMRTVCKVCSLTEEQIKTRSRKLEDKIPRQIAQYLMMEETKDVLGTAKRSMIGKMFNQNRTTAYNSWYAVQNAIDTNDRAYIDYLDEYYRLTGLKKEAD